MRLRRLALPAAVVITAGVSMSAAHASTTTTVQSGWWNEATVGPLAVPTTTPADQLQVSNGIAGPLAFAAVQITPADGTPSTDNVTLKLTIPTGTEVGLPAVSACVTTSSWKPGADQAPKTAPGYSCAHGFAVAGAVSNATDSWTVPMSWADASGSISLALVPTPGTTTPFSVSYDEPAPDAITLAAAAASSPDTTAPTTAPSSTFSSVPDDNFFPVPDLSGPTGSGVGSETGAGADTSVVPSVNASTSATPGPALAPTAQGTVTPVAAPASAAPGGGTNPVLSPSRVPKLVAFILLIFVGVALFGLAGQPDSAPRLLGGLQERVVRRRPGSAGVGGAVMAGAGVAPVTPGRGHDQATPPPMGGGARIRAHRQARLARARGAVMAGAGAEFVGSAGSNAGPGVHGLGVHGSGVHGSGVHGSGGHGSGGHGSGAALGTYAEPAVVAPVRGIGRFARPRHAPPTRI